MTSAPSRSGAGGNWFISRVPRFGGVEQSVDFLAVRHGGQVAASGGGEGAGCGTLINSFLQAGAGEESSEVAGGEAVAGADGVDRGDGKAARPSCLTVGSPGVGALGAKLDHHLTGAGVQVGLGDVSGFLTGEQPSFSNTWHTVARAATVLISAAHLFVIGPEIQP